MRRIRSGFALGLIVFIAVYAIATAAGFPSDRLGAGDGAVTSCDDNGFTVSGFTLDDSSRITGVTIGDISPTCIGGQLTVNLTNVSNVSIGVGGPVAVDGASKTVAISGLPSPADVKHEVVIIVGP